MRRGGGGGGGGERERGGIRGDRGGKKEAVQNGWESECTLFQKCTLRSFQSQTEVHQISWEFPCIVERDAHVHIWHSRQLLCVHILPHTYLHMLVTWRTEEGAHLQVKTIGVVRRHFTHTHTHTHTRTHAHTSY